MKLILAIVHREDGDNVIEALIREGHRSTTLSTTGGFLREGNTTILVGTTEDRLAQVLDIIKANTHEHVQRVPALLRIFAPQSEEVHIGAATIFVLNLEEMWRF